MAKKPSAETQLRSLKREYEVACEQLQKSRVEAFNYRTRATKAEDEVAEWKRRFDALLNRTPTVDAVSRQFIPGNKP